MAHKVLYRSKDNKSVAGVVAGLADYLDADVSFLRIITLVIIVLTGIIPGLVIYFVAAAIVPVKPEQGDKNAKA